MQFKILLFPTDICTWKDCHFGREQNERLDAQAAKAEHLEGQLPCHHLASWD